VPNLDAVPPAGAADDHELAAELAGLAGERLLRLREQLGPPGSAAAMERLRRAGDAGSQEFLAAELASRRPADAVLSEEAADNPARLTADRVWIIDPLDGTREFGEAGRTDWAVHVALWERGQLTAGAVALPAQGVVLSTASPPGRQAGAAQRPVRLVVSRTRPPEFVQQLADALGAELVPLGSAGAKAAAVITGQADAYVHSGGQHEWDSAAPVAVARAAGLHASRIDGSDLAYNCVPPSLPDILICPGSLSGTLLGAIGAARGG
jgi:3'(2'), 5'-bisphosphate nucleotidase